MDDSSTYNLFKKEREFFEDYKKIKPELFISLKVPEKKILSWIGIEYDFSSRQKGYLRLYPQDFIVEEISPEGKISEIEPKERKEILPKFVPFTLYADLVKVGISTPRAIFNLAEYLKIKPSKIGRGGLKDIKAVTSQRIALSNIDLEVLENVKKISSPNFFLTNFSFAKGSIAPGQIFGNRFTIFIRTEGRVDKKWISEKLKEIEEKGFLNFYGVQRFGTPRFLSHHFGKLILQGKYKKAIFAFLFQLGLKGIPLINEYKKEAEKLAPNWQKIENHFKKFPYTLRQELRLLSYLKKHPQNFIGALFFFEDQTKLWIYAYTSYLFNLLLSLEEKIELPEKAPLPLSDVPEANEIYKFWLERDGTQNFEKNIKPFKFLRLKKRLVRTRIFPQKIQFKILPEGVALSFILEKGAYATTFLMNLFGLKTGEPIPDWVKTKEYDIKKELEIGSVEETKRILGREIFVNL